MPLALSGAALLVGWYLDHAGFVWRGNCHWTQRAGALVTACGAWVAFRAAYILITRIGSGITRPIIVAFYGWVSVSLVILGTIIWGFADLVL